MEYAAGDSGTLGIGMDDVSRTSADRGLIGVGFDAVTSASTDGAGEIINRVPSSPCNGGTGPTLDLVVCPAADCRMIRVHSDRVVPPAADDGLLSMLRIWLCLPAPI